MTVRGPMVVWPLTCTWAMRRQPSPITTFAPITQYGPIVAPLPISAPRSTRAVESTEAIDLSDYDHGADFGLGHDLIGNLGFAAVPPHVLFPRRLGHVILERVARHDG